MLELNETIKKSHVAVYPVVFLFFLIEVGREECSKLGKLIIF